MTDTYTAPAHGWTCFHCGETFMHASPARRHFGATPDKTPVCLMKLEAGEHGLIRKIRGLELEIEELRRDIEFETTSEQAFSGRLQCLFNSYKPFRGCKSVQDVFNRYDTMEGRALAAEEKAGIEVNQ